jgi:cytochrome P450
VGRTSEYVLLKPSITVARFSVVHWILFEGGAVADRIEVYCDHNGPEFAADPAAALNQLRKQAPLVYSTAYDGFWMALDYGLVSQASRDHERFSTSREVHGRNALSMIIPLEWETEPLTPIELDPPEHTPYRKMLTALLSRTAIDRDLRPKLEAITDYCIDRFVESGEGDLVTDVAGPVPTVLTLAWLGMPTDDWQRVAKIQHNIVGFHPTSAEFAEAIAGLAWQNELITETIDRKRTEPADDVISFLSQQKIDGEPLSDKTIHEIVTLIIAGGVDTTTALMGQAFSYLDDHPEIRRQLLDDPRFRETAIEEFLRFYSPNTAHARTVTCPVELGGQQLQRGDRILLCWLGANRDPRVFDNPDQIVLDRSPNKHAAFGLSVHRCVGANLARLEIDVMLTKVLSRLPDYRIDRDRAHCYPAQGGTAGWSVMPVSFTPGRPVGDASMPV